MEGNGTTNKGIVINTKKRNNPITNRPRIRGKTNRKRFDQHNNSGLLASYLNLLAIPTTTPSLFFNVFIAEYK